MQYSQREKSEDIPSFNASTASICNFASESSPKVHWMAANLLILCTQTSFGSSEGMLALSALHCPERVRYMSTGCRENDVSNYSRATILYMQFDLIFTVLFHNPSHSCWMGLHQGKKTNEAYIEASVVFLLSHILHLPSCWLEATEGRNSRAKVGEACGWQSAGQGAGRTHVHL